MTSSIESLNVTEHTPLYENEKIERKIVQWRLLYFGILSCGKTIGFEFEILPKIFLQKTFEAWSYFSMKM